MRLRRPQSGWATASCASTPASTPIWWSTSRHCTARSATRGAAIDPRRILDTRTAARLRSGQSLVVDIATTATAAIVNLTAVGPSGPGFLTLYPCGAAIPTSSNLNVVAGTIVANRAVVSTGGSRQFCLYSSVDTDVVIDLEGYISPP